MPDITKLIEYSINNRFFDNIIYFLSENEKNKYEKIKKLLEKKNDFIDVILDFTNYEDLLPLIDSLPSGHDIESMKKVIMRDYLNYSILKYLGVENIGRFNYDINAIEEGLFEGNYEKYTKLNIPEYFRINDYLLTKAVEIKKYARIHFLLDSVVDIHLQQCINDLFAYRTSVAMFGYTTNDLLSNQTTTGVIIDSIHDYSLCTSDEYLNNVKKRSIYDKYKRR